VGRPSRIDRRKLLKRAAVAGGAAWAAPVLTSLPIPAYAQYGAPCEEGCTYVVCYTVQSDGSHSPCSECPSEVCPGGPPPATCAGSGCARVTSIQFNEEVNGATICTDCTVTGPPTMCMWNPDSEFPCCCAPMVFPAGDRCWSQAITGECPSEFPKVFQFEFTCATC
jgi:hypothetical protein